MTSLRTRIARILAPEVFRERDDQAAELQYMERQVKWWIGRTEEWTATSEKWRERAIKRQRALSSISAQRTERANATVKRMADIADAAIKEGEG